MPEQDYRITYQGKVAQGRDVGEVKRNLTSLFKLSDEKVEKLFSGKAFVVAKNVDYDSAMRYKMAFETAGAVCRVEEVGSEPRSERSSETVQQKITCPKCGFEQEKTEECRQCGIIISKYLNNLENEQEMPHVTPRRARPLYFAVSKAKLIVLSLVTLGLYEIYWFYKNWKLIKSRTGLSIRPFWRALFAVFYCHSLFKSVQESAISHDCRSSVSPGWLAFLYVALTVAWRLPDPYGLVSLLTFLPLLPVQAAINEINARAASTAQRDMGHSLQDVLWT
jgi:hypothetical protein